MWFSSPHDKDPDSDLLPPVSPQAHYQISELTQDFINLPWFLAEISEDNALIVRTIHAFHIVYCSLKRKAFDWNLCNHLLVRTLGCELNGSNDNLFTNKDHASIHFSHGHIYKHKTVRINFMTYDLQQKQDSINPRTQTSRYYGTSIWRCILQRISSLLVCSCHQNFSCRCLSHWRKINDGWALQDGFLMGSLVWSRWVSLRWMESSTASSNWLSQQWRQAGDMHCTGMNVKVWNTWNKDQVPWEKP